MSSSQNMSRKRPAPGTTPVGYSQQPQQYQNGYGNSAQPAMTNDQFLNWGAAGEETNMYPNQQMYSMPQNTYTSQNPAQASTQLARRPVNQAVTRAPAQTNQWMSEQASTPEQHSESNSAWTDDIEELVAKAQVAKKESQSKRKQIPPFVLKLHSFLENPKNTDLIRWADDGKSFVVLNEDEFANKLIPELFKHNNYASFVRQLNMYGFHKKVGLSDNSMRASERKAKSPSEYFNPYFRRGYPDLLWLIQKPKTQATTQKTKGRGKSEDREDEEDYADDSNSVDGPRPQLAISQGERPMTAEQMQGVQRELTMIRRQQGQITQMLAQLKREHDALVDQANDYQDKHSRHEQSINAILTFLATLYNRNLQHHDAAQDVGKIFAPASADKNTNVIVDLPEGSLDSAQQPYKRQRLMITDGNDTRAQTMSPSTTNSPLPRSSRRSSQMARSPQSAHVEEVFEPEPEQPSQQRYPPTQSRPRQEPDDMMSLIHNTNARNSGQSTPVPNFSNVLNDLESAGGNTPISQAQRDNMIRMLRSQPPSSGKRPGSSGGNNGILMTPPRRNSQMAQFDQQLAASQQHLDHLAQLQARQDQSVENLRSLLQPLSPSGSIPGDGDGKVVPPAPLSIDDFLKDTDYFGNLDDDIDGDFDFTNLNNTAFDHNTNSAGNFDFADDGPLFGDVDENEAADNNFLNTTTGYDGSDDRVQSVGSSSATTPQNANS